MENNFILSKRFAICFILDHSLKPYRIPFFNGLAENGLDITICHPGKELKLGAGIKQIILKQIKIWKFEYRKLPDLSLFDIVVHMQNLRVLNLWFLSLNPFKRYKLIQWGIGVSSANGLSKDKTLISRIRNLLAHFSSAQVLYSDFALSLFSKNVRSKTFIANNTIFNPNPRDFSRQEKDSFLFIGNLNNRKGLNLLINAFNYIKDCEGVKIKLIIIGDGPEKSTLQKIVKCKQNTDSIIFTGNINDDNVKLNYFKTAIACISPLQAGLSVLESFSYGVPFIAFENAISGGEHLNIKDGYNGYLVKSEEELSKKIMLLIKDSSLSFQLGHNSYKYYMANRQMSHMIGSFINVFNYVLTL